MLLLLESRKIHVDFVNVIRVNFNIMIILQRIKSTKTVKMKENNNTLKSNNQINKLKEQ